MKTKSIFLLMAFLIGLPGVTNAQLRNLRKAINNELEHKAESEVEKSVLDKENKKLTDTTSTHGKEGSKETARGLFGGKTDIKYNDEYKFTGRIYMQMEKFGKDASRSDYYTYFSNNAKDAGIEVKPENVKEGDKGEQAVFIFDGDNRCFIILSESGDSKTGIISTFPSDSAIAAQSKNVKTTANEQPAKEPTQEPTPVEKATITKTGNTRMIAGFRCEEYRIVSNDNEGSANVWMTKDVKLKADNKYWGKAGVPTYYGYPEFEGAVMLAMESFDKDNKPDMSMETKEINNSFDHSISTVGYKLIKLNFGSAGRK